MGAGSITPSRRARRWKPCGIPCPFEPLLKTAHAASNVAGDRPLARTVSIPESPVRDSRCAVASPMASWLWISVSGKASRQRSRWRA